MSLVPSVYISDPRLRLEGVGLIGRPLGHLGRHQPLYPLRAATVRHRVWVCVWMCACVEEEEEEKEEEVQVQVSQTQGASCLKMCRPPLLLSLLASSGLSWMWRARLLVQDKQAPLTDPAQTNQSRARCQHPLPGNRMRANCTVHTLHFIPTASTHSLRSSRTSVDRQTSIRNHANLPQNTVNPPNASPRTRPGNCAMPSMPSIQTLPRSPIHPLAIDPSMAPDHPPAPAPNGWSRPNAHAASQQSKTSQYIDKITSENEKLKRELNAERLAREDEAKRVSAARSKAEDSRAEHQHLQLLVDTNARALERKDRKLDEMKAQLDQETKRRKAADQRAEEALKMLGDTRSETQRQLAAAYEQKHLAETNADTAREGYKRMTDGYEKKIKYITEQMNELRHKQYENADKLKRQQIISDQLQHELARKERTEDKMVDMMGQYKREHLKEMEHLTREAERLRLAVPAKEKELNALLHQMQETKDKMKWTMAQHQRQL